MKIDYKKLIISSRDLLTYSSARIIPVILNLIAIPILLRNSGAATFGLITIILSLYSIQVLVDLGLINSFLPVFVMKLHNSEFEEARIIYISTVIRIFVYSCLFSLLSFPLVEIFLEHINASDSGEFSRNFSIAIYIVIFSNIFGGFVNFTNRILLVFEKNRLSSVLNSISNSLVAILIILCSFIKAPIIPMTLGIVFIPIAISLSTLIWISWKNNLLYFQNFSWGISYFGFRNQLGNWLVQVSAILSVQFDALILSLYNDSSEVARYGVIAKVFLLVVTIYSWTTAHETIVTIRLGSQGRMAETHNEFMRYFRKLMILMSAVMIPLTFSLKEILEVFTSGKFSYTYFEIFISELWCFSLLLTTKISRILFGEGVLRGYFQISMLGTVVNVASTFWFCSRGLGIIGPFLATILSTFLIFLPFYFYTYRKSSSG